MKGGREKLRVISWTAGLVIFVSAVLIAPIQASACAGCRACEMGTACACGCQMAESAVTSARETAEKAVDPVCGMRVDVQKAEKKGLVVEYQGRKYYFCMKADMEKFKKNPEKYIHGMKGMHRGSMDELHERMMNAYSKAMEIQKKLEASDLREGVKLAGAFLKEAEEFMNTMDEMGKMMGEMKMHGEKKMEHHLKMKEIFEKLKDSVKELKRTLKRSEQKKILSKVKSLAKEFVSVMDRCHERMMEHMEEMKKGHHQK